MHYQPIENYGVIGDLSTVALVGLDGSIDFLCLPHFDSPTLFAALLDHRKGGCFRIAPVLEGHRRKQLYLPDSNVLLTRFLAEEGVAEITDFMPLGGPFPGPSVVRRVRAVRGDLRFLLRCSPRFDYARATHTVSVRGDAVTFTPQGPDQIAVRLRSSVPLALEGPDATATFSLRAGQTAFFVLEIARSDDTDFVAAEINVEDSLQTTLAWWRNWLARSRYQGRWREMVNRSALLLKLLTSERHGSIVAAPTFGLPEELGGTRNWDYRYTWIRDGSLTLNALLRLGFTDEAAAFFDWLGRRCCEVAHNGPLQIMYGLDGRHELTEEQLLHLEGYRGSAPVRVGNGAAQQLQLDIYGELLDALHRYELARRTLTFDTWTSIKRMLEWLEHHWREPDEGIWEVRGGRREFLFSRLMCWTAFDRALRLARLRSFPAPLAHWNRIRRDIRADIDAHFWNAELQCFVQHKGSRCVDASCLLIPSVRFLPPNDTRWLFTLRRIEDCLVHDSLVFRYDTERAASDGLRGGEGTFNLCSFWYVECIARSGDLDKARLLFEKALGYANHLGLYSEELGPRGEHLGNFPQAFTHLALISTADCLDRLLSRRDSASRRSSP